MKVALITDTHAGIRNDSQVFLDLQTRFYEEIFWPTVDTMGVEHIIHLGDYFDRRKYINFATLESNRRAFLEPLCERVNSSDMSMHLIIGNHDTFFKNTNRLNSPRQLLPLSECKITLVENIPLVVKIGGLDIGLVPWICEDNHDVCMDFLKKTRAEVIMGHFEIMGFEVFKGHVMQHGMSQEDFRRFDLVYSGHYHHKSEIGNIKYLGSPHEATWVDYDDPRGFHIFDTETRELEFIENPIKAFVKVLYDDKDMDLDEVLREDFSDCQKKYVRVVVEHKSNPYMLEKVIERIQSESPAQLSVVEDYTILHQSGEADEAEIEVTEDGQIVDKSSNLDLGRDTLYFVENYIDSLQVERKDELKSLFRVLYLESAEVIV